MSSTDAELAVVTFTFSRLRAESSANSLPSFGRTTSTLRSIESAEITFANSAVFELQSQVYQQRLIYHQQLLLSKLI